MNCQFKTLQRDTAVMVSQRIQGKYEDTNDKYVVTVLKYINKIRKEKCNIYLRKTNIEKEKGNSY